MEKVIWIDDEYEKQDALIDSAYTLHNIELIPFKTSKAGMEELSKNLFEYQAVILDAKVFNESEDEVAKLTGLQSSIYRLKELSTKRYIPYVVFTGQKDLDSNATFEDMLPGVPVFKKGIQNDAMFKYLIEEINKLEETKIKKDFHQAFDACNFIDKNNNQILLQILMSVRKPLDKFDDELYFTHIRIILESMFRAANKIGLLHDNCLQGGKVNLSESSLFLSGEATKYAGVTCKTRHFPKIISNAVKSIIFITGAASHTTDLEIKNNINIAEYRKYLKTPYLLYSLTFQLMDILVWYKNYANENNDIEKNKLLWVTVNTTPQEGEWIAGKITRVAGNGFGTFESTDDKIPISILPDKMKEFNLKEQQKIEVLTKLDKTGTKTQIDTIRII